MDRGDVLEGVGGELVRMRVDVSEVGGRGDARPAVMFPCPKGPEGRGEGTLQGRLLEG